jgi:hypothetical protein
MMKITRSLLVAVLLLAAMPAHAAIDCTGTVTNLSVQLNAEGMLTLGLSSSPSATYLCAINAEVNGVAPVVCRTMYGTLMAAKLAGKRVTIRFYDHNSCASVPNWDLPGALGWNLLLLD